MGDYGNEERILIISILRRKISLISLSHLQSCIGMMEIISCSFCKKNDVSGKLWRMSGKRIRLQN